MALVELGTSGRREMTSRRKPHDPHPIGFISILIGMRPHPADCPLRISEFDGVVISRSQPVLQHKRRNSHRVEPVRDLAAFVIAGQHGVTPSWSYNYGRS